MNREILYRGKQINNEKWHYGDLFKFGNKRYINICPRFVDEYIVEEDKIALYSFGNFIEVIPETVGQYTSLKDMFGEKVFEGDYIYCDSDEEIGIVKFDEGEFVCVYGDVIDENRFADIIACSHVIGNIHDNPKLMEYTENEN